MACTNCHHSKKKCLFGSDPTACLKCLSSSVACVPWVSRQGQRPSDPPAKAEDVVVVVAARAEVLASVRQAADATPTSARTVAAEVTPELGELQSSFFLGAGGGPADSGEEDRSTSSAETDESDPADSDSDWEPEDPAPDLITGFGEDVEELNTPAPGSPPPSVHNNFRGADFCTAYDIASDSQTIFCQSYTHGSTEVWTMVGSNELAVWRAKERFRIPFEGPPTFVRSACMVKLPRSCAGSLIAYRQKRGKRGWRLAVIEAVRYLQADGAEHCFELWEAVGPIGEDGIPLLLRCQDWDSALEHLELKKLSLANVELYFLNQVSTRGLVVVFPSPPRLISIVSCHPRSADPYL